MDRPWPWKRWTLQWHCEHFRDKANVNEVVSTARIITTNIYSILPLQNAFASVAQSQYIQK